VINYSRKAIAGLAYLFRPYNDIDVYVEDTTCRNMYEVLLERMLDGQARVTRVFQLGARNDVMATCKNDQGPGGRPRLYIIDGDFDVVLGGKPPGLKYLYRLSVYCSENLVFTEAATLEVAFENLTNTSRDDIEATIRFSHFLDDVVEKLTPLLVVYVAARILKANVQTTGFNVTRLFVHRLGFPRLSASKIMQRIVQVRQELEAISPIEEVKSAMEKAENLIPNSSVDTAKLISGKTYLLPLLYHHLRSRARFSGTLDQLKTRLARYCELDVDPGLLEAVRATSKAIGVSFA
jgi:hypothetical protein